MEFQFAKKTLRIPVIPCVVGTSWNWQKSKIGLMIAGDLFIDFTDPSKYSQKFEELFSRLDGLVGANSTEDNFQAATQAVTVNSANIQPGDGFEVLCDNLDDCVLNFASVFCKDPIKDPGTGDYLRANYWWPVEVLEVSPERPDELYVDYASYEGEEWRTWVPKSKLRPVTYASVSTQSLKPGSRVEVKLTQRSGPDSPYAYCWVAGSVKELLETENKVRVKLDAEVPEEEYFDEAIVKRTSIRVL